MQSQPRKLTLGSPEIVATFDAHGVAIWCEDEQVLARLEGERALGLRRHEESLVLSGAAWRDRLEMLGAMLSATERRMLRATAVLPSGRFCPWRSLGFEHFCFKVATNWFPQMVNGGDLVTFFQPIVRVVTGDVLGFEALVRGHVQGELKPGGAIIDAARVHNALYQFDEVCRLTAVHVGVPQLLEGEKLFVNFLPGTVRDPIKAFDSVWNALAASGADPSCLVFEVVESEAFPDLEFLKVIVSEIRRRGSKVALDDLGTGNAALVYIDSLVPDYIKLAKGLVADYPRQEDLLLVRGLVDHARLRGIRVIAEGVENLRQWQAIVSLDIDYVQGWLVGRPEAEPRRDLGMERLLAA